MWGFATIAPLSPLRAALSRHILPPSASLRSVRYSTVAALRGASSALFAIAPPGGENNEEENVMNATMIQTTGTVEQIDPNLLVLEENIRQITPDDLEAGFVESIRQNGVIQPVVGWRDDAGMVRIRYGQRRTVGAQVAGVATMPVYVTTVDQADEVQRIVAQLVENDQRADLTVGERVEAWKQLELAGLSVTAIAKRTGSKRADVKTGVAVAKNETGARLLGEVGLNLEQAAELLEFEDDQDLVAELTGIAVSDPD